MGGGRRVHTTGFTCICEYVVHVETNSGCHCTGSVPLAFLLFLAKVSLCGPAWPDLELTTKLRLILSSEVYLPLPPGARESSCALPCPHSCFQRWNLPPRVSRLDRARWKSPGVFLCLPPRTGIASMLHHTLLFNMELEGESRFPCLHGKDFTT